MLNKIGKMKGRTEKYYPPVPPVPTYKQDFTRWIPGIASLSIDENKIWGAVSESETDDLVASCDLSSEMYNNVSWVLNVQSNGSLKYIIEDLKGILPLIEVPLNIGLNTIDLKNHISQGYGSMSISTQLGIEITLKLEEVPQI